MNKDNKNTAKKNGLFSTLKRWGRRMFFGASNEMAKDVLFVEKIESPSVMAVKSFFRRKLAVAALIVLISMFLFVFIGPVLMPVDINYTDPLQANLAPNYSMLSVPDALAKDVNTISGFSNFTVGLSNAGKVYIWGNTVDPIFNIDYSKFPDEVKNNKIIALSAGSDHIIAITEDGKIVGWGDDNLGQYGYLKSEQDSYLQMPEEFINGTIDVSKLDQLICGLQVTGIVLDGRLYMWGNNRSMLSIDEYREKPDLYSEGVKKVAFSNYYMLVLKEDGSVTGGSTLSLNQQGVSSKDGKVKNVGAYLSDKTAVDIAATNNCYAVVLSDGSVVAFGGAAYGEKKVPTIPADEKIISVSAGTRHFVVVTDKGNAYSWGHNDNGQASLQGVSADTVFCGSKQTYVVNENNQITNKVGLKGYLMGTDSLGRDVFTRIIHGGKMTMTVGAVAVIVSTIIAIIIGCVSGYFGGWVDMLLMRFTEICSSIPFLPFAMMLSYVIQGKAIKEETRIIIIMIMLGVLSWPGLARMIRAQVLAEREKEFVIAAKSMGIKEKAIAFKHILPNVISIILVNVTLDFAGCMLTESSLSYLGFGVQQPQPTWGNMLNGANNGIVIQNFWWQWFFPSLFLAIATISINIIGDTLRDVFDPKSSSER